MRPSSGKKSGEPGRSDASECSDADLSSSRGRQKAGLDSRDSRTLNKSNSSDVVAPGMQALNLGSSASRARTRLDSLSESDDHLDGGGDVPSARLASGRSKIPRRKKKERSKMTGVSEKEELLESYSLTSRTERTGDDESIERRVSSGKSVEGRVIKNGADVNVRVGGSGNPTFIIYYLKY